MKKCALHLYISPFSIFTHQSAFQTSAVHLHPGALPKCTQHQRNEGGFYVPKRVQS